MAFEVEGEWIRKGGRGPERGAAGSRGSTTGEEGGLPERRVKSWVLLEDSLVCRAVSSPVKVNTWLLREVTMDFKDGEGVAMDASLTRQRLYSRGESFAEVLGFQHRRYNTSDFYPKYITSVQVFTRPYLQQRTQPVCVTKGMVLLSSFPEIQ